MENSNLNIVLFHPTIPGNTGSIGRTCVALNLRLILIGPYGFEINEKSVRRAGLDYWKYVQLTEYTSLDEFFKKEAPQSDQLFFYSRFAKKEHYKGQYSKGSYLIFGSEIEGLPETIHQQYPNHLYKLPMYSDKIRSLNLANTVTAAAYEGIRQIHYSD